MRLRGHIRQVYYLPAGFFFLQARGRRSDERLVTVQTPNGRVEYRFLRICEPVPVKRDCFRGTNGLAAGNLR